MEAVRMSWPQSVICVWLHFCRYILWQAVWRCKKYSYSWLSKRLELRLNWRANFSLVSQSWICRRAMKALFQAAALKESHFTTPSNICSPMSALSFPFPVSQFQPWILRHPSLETCWSFPMHKTGRSICDEIHSVSWHCWADWCFLTPLTVNQQVWTRTQECCTMRKETAFLPPFPVPTGQDQLSSSTVKCFYRLMPESRNSGGKTYSAIRHQSQVEVLTVLFQLKTVVSCGCNRLRWVDSKLMHSIVDII